LGNQQPYIFVTGYDDPTVLPDEYRNVPRLAKPFDQNQLIQLVAEYFRKP
jgi:FixJ family two-component response regulator